MPQEFSAGAVIFRRDAIETLYLLLHYEEGHWDFVKGHIEKEEEEWQTIVRECREETGIKDIEFVVGFEKTIEYFYKREGTAVSAKKAAHMPAEKSGHGSPLSESSDNRDTAPLAPTGSKRETMHKEVTFLLAETKTKKIKLSNEHVGFEWLVYEEAIKRLTFENAKKILNEANDFLEAH